MSEKEEQPSRVLILLPDNGDGLPPLKSRPEFSPKYQLLASPCPKEVDINSNNRKIMQCLINNNKIAKKTKIRNCYLIICNWEILTFINHDVSIAYMRNI